MLIVGAGGHSREIYDILKDAPDVYIYEEFKTDACLKWGNTVKFIRTDQDIKDLFAISPKFIIGVGDPKLRERLFNKLIEMNGVPENIISSTSLISSNNVSLGIGLNIMAFVFVSNNVTIGTGTLLNTGCRIHHDCTIGSFCQISPNVTITGNCTVGNNCSIGTSATILPNIKIGNNAVIAAGSVVTKDVKDDQKVMGVPAK